MGRSMAILGFSRSHDCLTVGRAAASPRFADGSKVEWHLSLARVARVAMRSAA